MFELPDSPSSLWLAEYGEYKPEPRLAGDLTVDVAVIGGGFVGMATEIALKRRDPSLEVAVLEAQDRQVRRERAVELSRQAHNRAASTARVAW
jgi:NADPH-dependent 2,4-dienoyl-CoA reductase/sulfur reductase-like enzyme